MDFNTAAMKQRTRVIMKELKPSPFITILAIGALTMALYAGICFSILAMDKKAVLSITALIVLGMLMGMIYVSYCWYCLSAVREECPGWKEIFGAFIQMQGKALITVLVKTAIMSLLFLMCYIPGIIACYWLRPLEYIIKDNPELSVFSAIGKSVKMMKGHNLELFKLDISFVGWYFLAICTCWLGGIYVVPFAGFTYAEFYDYLKGQEELYR